MEKLKLEKSELIRIHNLTYLGISIYKVCSLENLFDANYTENQHGIILNSGKSLVEAIEDNVSDLCLASIANECINQLEKHNRIFVRKENTFTIERKK